MPPGLTKTDKKDFAELAGIVGKQTKAKSRSDPFFWPKPLLDAEFIEMTIPDKPTSSKQKYRLTEKGRQVVKHDT